MTIVKTTIAASIFIASIFLMSYHSEAQLLRKMKEEVLRRGETKVVKETGDAADDVMNKTVDGLKGKKQQTTAVKSEAAEISDTGSSKSQPSTAKPSAPAPFEAYKNYDFVPGDKIIFAPDFTDEPDAELPARFGIYKGNAEIQSYHGDKILHLNQGAYTTVYPLMNTESYLPDQFTVEFDLMYENEKSTFDKFNDFRVCFASPDDKNPDGYPAYEFSILSNTTVKFSKSNRVDVNKDLAAALQTNGVWHHVAIYVNKNILKGYINEFRVAATNSLPKAAGKLYVRTDGRYGMFIKNFRIAAGGDDKYKKIVTDGKFITHGILFDVNKSTIKPESMGALNEIVKLMNQHDDLNFEIQGHTDSDGKADANIILSEKRAEAVKEKLISLGINEARLTTKGFGATKPIDKNDSAEGKSNNRRVEFVKR